MSDSEMDSNPGKLTKVSAFIHKKAWLLIIIFIVAVIIGIVAAGVISTQNDDEDNICYEMVAHLCSTNPNLRCFPVGLLTQFDVSVDNPAISLDPLPSDAQEYIKAVDPTAQVVDPGGFIGKSSNWTSTELDQFFRLWVSPNSVNRLFLVQRFWITNEIMIYGGLVQDLVMNYNQTKVNVLPDATAYIIGNKSVLQSMGYRKSLGCGATLPSTGNTTLAQAVDMGGLKFQEAHKLFLA